MEYAQEGEVFDQVARESEDETLMNQVTAKLRFYQICPYYIDGECSRRRNIRPCGEGARKVIMMSIANEHWAKIRGHMDLEIFCIMLHG